MSKDILNECGGVDALFAKCFADVPTKGRKYIRTYRKKTDVEAFIPLHPIAEQILSLYNTTDDSKPIFPLPCRDMIWFEIHELGFAHKFKHNLSYHQSRHTFGTLLVSAGVPMENRSKLNRLYHQI